MKRIAASIARFVNRQLTRAMKNVDPFTESLDKCLTLQGSRYLPQESRNTMRRCVMSYVKWLGLSETQSQYYIARMDKNDAKLAA